MSSLVSRQDLALFGGTKSVPRILGERKPKVGIEEFMAIAERFGFTRQALGRIRASISEEDLGSGPHLAGYSGGVPGGTGKAALEQLACDIFGVNYALPVSSGTAAPLSPQGSGRGRRSSVRLSDSTRQPRPWSSRKASPSSATWTHRWVWIPRRSRI